MALFNSPNMTAILQATPGEAGTAGGLTNITRTLGITLGPAAALAWSAAAGGVSGFRARLPSALAGAIFVQSEWPAPPMTPSGKRCADR